MTAGPPSPRERARLRDHMLSASLLCVSAAPKTPIARQFGDRLFRFFQFGRIVPVQQDMMALFNQQSGRSQPDA